MTKTSGRRVVCMTCSAQYTGKTCHNCNGKTGTHARRRKKERLANPKGHKL